LERRNLVWVAGGLMLLLLVDKLILTPFMEGSDLLDKQIQEARKDLDTSQLTIQRGPRIQASWEAHAARAPRGSVRAVEATFQSDLLAIFKQAKIQPDDFKRVREAKHGAFVESVFAASFTASNSDLVNLMEALDSYEGILRANLVQVGLVQDKQQDKLAVTIEVSTIWFSATNGGRS
jgi:hypothetical protein